MRHAFELRKHFNLGNFGTSISRKSFEANFTKTKEKVTFTFNGWDGKSYEGESRTSRVYRTELPGYEEFKFVKVGNGVHYIDEDKLVEEQATGEMHPEAEWLIDVLRRR